MIIKLINYYIRSIFIVRKYKILFIKLINIINYKFIKKSLNRIKKMLIEYIRKISYFFNYSFPDNILLSIVFDNRSIDRVIVTK